jgi:uncharacterized protein YgiM (DUF1202 family)
VKGIVSTSNRGKLNVREAPSASARLVFQIPYGETVTVDNLTDEWTSIEYQNKTGYAKTEFIKPVSTSVSKEDLQKIYNSLSECLATIKLVMEK